MLLEKLAGTQLVTVGGDKGSTRDIVKECRNLRVTPHVTRNRERRGGSAIDGSTPVTLSGKESEANRRIFRVAEDDRADAKVRHRGACKVDWIFAFACAAYNLMRMRTLAAAVPLGVSRGRSVPCRACR